MPRKTKSHRVVELLVQGKSNEEILEMVDCDSSLPGWYRSLMNHELPKNQNSQKFKIMEAIKANHTDEEIIASVGAKKYLVKDCRWGMLIKTVYGNNTE